MATRPGQYPLHDTSNTNSALLPTIHSLLGFPPNSVADNQSVNALLRSTGKWTQYDDRTLLRAEDSHNASTAYRLSAASFGYATSAGLGPLDPTTTPMYLYRGNVIRFDATFVANAGLSQITFQASKQTWIYCDSDGVVRVETVALATPSSPAVGEFVVVGITTDATDVTANDTTGAPAREFHFTGPDVYFDVDVIAGSLTADLGTFEAIVAGGNGSALPSIEAVASTGANSIKVSGNGVQAAIAVSGGLGPALTATSSSGTSAALTSTHDGGQPGLQGTNTGTGVGVSGTSGATSGAGVRGVTGNATDAGVLGESAAAASSVGVAGSAKHVDAFGVVGRTLAAATSSSGAVIALAVGDGRGVYASAVDGYGAVFESDTTSPKRAAVRIVPQNADPTTASAGDLIAASARGNRPRYYDGSKWRSVHSSHRGNVFGYATLTDSFHASTTGDVMDITIVAEEVGVVELLVTGEWSGRTDTTTMTPLFKDITNAATVTGQALNALDVDSAAAWPPSIRIMPFQFRKMYTLVTASTLFRVRLNFSATSDWYDLLFTVRGVY